MPSDATDASGAAGAPTRRDPGPPKRSAQRPARRRSREFAVQGLYQWLVAGNDIAAIDAQLRELDGWAKADHAHLKTLLHGCIQEASAIDEHLARHADRPTRLLSPIEHAVMMVGIYELIHCLEVPYRVVLNEAVELAKLFGGVDGHRYVNGVLDKTAADLRPLEHARPAGGTAAASRSEPDDAGPT